MPIVATLLVALAVAAMVALGVWQLQRRTWKDALIARYADAPRRPPVAYPGVGGLPDDALFRRSSLVCLEAVSWTAEAGRGAAGASGWRHIASCRTGAEGPGALVDAGVSDSPEAPNGWRGGLVRGIITTAPSHESLIARLFRRPPVRPMLVATTPAPGLAASQPPSVDEIPNNHLAYAIQWFLFATTATVIYLIAMYRRAIADPPRRR